jgi:hypothetical protein
MQLVCDSRHDRRSNLQTIADPTWAQIEQAIRRLDASTHTEVAIDNHGHMSVGGGDGRYFMSIFTDDERSLIASDPSKNADDKVHLVTGGQKALLPARRIVDTETALKAARSFFETGRPDATLSWIAER